MLYTRFPFIFVSNLSAEQEVNMAQEKRTVKAKKGASQKCDELNRNYSTIEATRQCASIYRPATIKEIVAALKLQQELYPGNIPSDLTVERLLNNIAAMKDDSIRKQANRLLSEMEKFLYPGDWDGYASRDLTLFQILRFYENPAELTYISLDEEHTPSTKECKFALGYRFPPKILGLQDVTKAGLTQAQYIAARQAQISARWQFILDSILDTPHIKAGDAKGLHQVLSNSCTLGEIYHHEPPVKDKETIDFRLLSRLVMDLQATEKHGSDHKGIKCLKIILGKYSANASGELSLSAGRVIHAYPVQTRLFREHYYLAVAIPGEEEQLTYEYLRIDHILDCEPTDEYPLRQRHTLNDPPAIDDYLDGTAYNWYTVSACPDTALQEMVDLFGKSNLSECKKESDGWHFTIRIPVSREKLLYALHNKNHIAKWKTDKQSRTSAKPNYYWEIMESFSRWRAANSHKTFFYNAFELSLKIGNFSNSARNLVNALQNQDRNEVMVLLEQWDAGTLSPEEAAWCCYLGLRMDALVFESLLSICPCADTFTALLSATVRNSNEGVHLNLVSLAAYYDRRDILKLLIDFGASTDAAKNGDSPALHVAICEGSVDCLEYLLECDKVDKRVTDRLLRLFAKAARNGSTVGKGYEIAAPKLLGCSISADGFSPFPEGMTLEHILSARNLNLLLQYCGLYPDSLNEAQAREIMDTFPWFPSVERYPENFVSTMTIITKACPAILLTTRCKYLLAVAGLCKKGTMPAQLPALLKRIRDPQIAMEDYQYHNWFGRDGMIHRWEQLNDPIVGRKTPLVPVIYRNTPPPCDPDCISTEIMDTLLTKFKILGKAPEGSLSVLARYTLQFASKENIEKALQPGGFLADEDPTALNAYLESIRDASLMDSSRQDMLVNLIGKK